MESLQHIKSRLGAVKNVGKITKAMEVVSATKMRKAQEIALRSRPYSMHALYLLQKLIAQSPIVTPLMQQREIKKTLVVIIASDRGLAGSFNAQVMRKTDALIANPNTVVVAVGKKAIQYAQKKNMPIIESYSGFGDLVEYHEVMPLARLIVDGFLAGSWDDVIIVSTHFRTTLKQETLIRHMLPTSPEKIKSVLDEILPEHGRYAEIKRDLESDENNKNVEYIFEPSAPVVLETLAPHLISSEIYHLVLEANASEHSARMVAMKTASDNANDLSASLALAANKARQASITKEMIEIISTQNAL